MKLRAVMLFVKNLEKVDSFYEMHFGLKRIGKAEDGYLELSSGALRLALHRARPSKGDNSHSPAKIVFACADVHTQVKKFEKAGLKFGKMFEWEGFYFADTKDPEKNPAQISSRS